MFKQIIHRDLIGDYSATWREERALQRQVAFKLEIIIHLTKLGCDEIVRRMKETQL